MFEALAKTIKEHEKILGSKDLYHDSQEHKAFYNICKGVKFYCWDFMGSREDQYDQLARTTHNRCCFNRFISFPEEDGCYFSNIGASNAFYFHN
jgi:hypothetical protein